MRLQYLYALATGTSRSLFRGVAARQTMSEPREQTGPMYNAKTIIFRLLTVLVYIIFGSGVFHVLEKDEASMEIAKFEEHYNKTMTSILSRYVANTTEIGIIMAEIRGAFLQQVFPKEWDISGGFNISTHAITTIG